MSDLLNDYENNGFFHETPAAYLDDTGAMPGMAVPYSGTGLTRLLNAASTPFPVNLALDRVPRVAGSIFSSLTDYDAVPAGSHRVRLTQESPSNALLLEKELIFPPDAHSTAVLVDSAGQGVDLLQFMDQSCAPDTRDQACLAHRERQHGGLLLCAPHRRRNPTAPADPLRRGHPLPHAAARPLQLLCDRGLRL